MIFFDLTLKEVVDIIVQFLRNVVGTEIILLSILFGLRLIGIDLYFKTWWYIHLLYIYLLKIRGRKIVFVYTDCDDQFITTRNLATNLKRSINDKSFKVLPIEEPASLLTWPLIKTITKAVIVIITDVSILSTNKKRRELVQRKLFKFVQSGGILVLGHDVLYRRTKNEILQRLAGCKLTCFRRQEDITYKKNNSLNTPRTSSNQSLLDHLPDSFTLADREYVVGTWREGVEFIYTHSDDKNIPLVTRRVVQEGAVFWINSGDHTEDGPPRPITKPSKDLLDLLSKIIKHGIE